MYQQSNLLVLDQALVQHLAFSSVNEDRANPKEPIEIYGADQVDHVDNNNDFNEIVILLL